jgi:hypothetical protein
MKQQLREIGRMYIDKRARDNLAIGVIHEEKDHLHLHLMISANKIYERNRHRLSKDDFLQIQNEVSREAQQKYPELALDNLYRAENVKSPLKEQVRLTKDEQERAVRTDKEPSQKVKLAAKIHTLLAQHQDQKSLDQALQSQGLSLYQRGKTLGVIDQDGKRHRLSTLGVEPHYQQWQEQQRTVDQARNNPITPEKQPKQDPSILKDIVTRAQERISDLLQSEKTTEQRAAADRIKTHGQQSIDTLRRVEAIQQRSEQRLEAMRQATTAPQPAKAPDPQPRRDIQAEALRRMQEISANQQKPPAPNRSTPPPTPAAKPSPSPQTSSLAQQMIDERRQRESAVTPPQAPPARDPVADRVTQLKQARDKGKDLERDAER